MARIIRSGPQPEVKYCPACKGEVVSVRSIKQRAENSHTYRCQSEDCGKEFEINQYFDNAGNPEAT